MRTACNNENGAALVIALMFLTILGLLGTTAYVITTTDMKIGANYKASVQASNVAQAGINEALYRLGLFDDNGTVAPPSGSMININGLTDNNAAISIDPNGLLSNDNDDDGNGAVDDISDLNYNSTWDNRNWKTKIMLKTSDDADTTTTVYTPTIQPSGSWLEYSSAIVDGTELTIEFKKDDDDMDSDGDTSEIVFYDASLTNPFNVDATSVGGNPASGQAVVVIASTGKAADGSIKKLRVAAVHQPLDIDGKAAVMVNMSPNFSGSAIISGFNHDGATTSADCTGSCGESDWDDKDGLFDTNGIDNHGGAEKYIGTNPSPPPPTKHINEDDDDVSLYALGPPPPNSEEEQDTEDKIPYGNQLQASGHKPGAWTPLGAGAVSPHADVFGGDSTTPWKIEAAPAWLTLADMLGVTQETLNEILAGANVTEADMDGSGKLSVAPQGVMHINNAGGNALKITSSTPDNDKGWGLMYVTGDVDFQILEFKGLMYVEGDAKITGGFWLLGCIAVKGVTTGNFTSGDGIFLYSTDALKYYTNAGMKYTTLSWYDDLG